MISRSAIAEFLATPHESFDWMKACSEDEIQEALWQLEPRPDFGPKPLRHHQCVSFLLGTAYPGFYHMLDTGLGKTRVALELDRYRMLAGWIDRSFILMPTDTAADGWADQIERWMPGMPYKLLQGSSEEKWDDLNSLGTEGMVIGTYIGFLRMCSRLADVREVWEDRRDKVEARLLKLLQEQRHLEYEQGSWVPRRQEILAKEIAGDEKEIAALTVKAEKKASRVTIDDGWATDLCGRFQSAVFDEVANFARETSTSFDLTNQLARTVKHRTLLAARAFGNNPLVVWPQYQLMDNGETLGSAITLFRESFFKKSRKFVGFKHTFDKSKADLLSSFLGHRSITYTADECLDLPPVVLIEKRTNLPESTRAYYDTLMSQVRGNKDRPENLWHRLRQLSSGYIAIPGDEEGQKVEIAFDRNPKLDLLMDELVSLPLDKKALIFHEYTYSGELICAALARAGFKHGWVWGGTKDYRVLKRGFDSDPDFRFLVLNVKKGAESLDLQAGSYEYFFETPSDPRKRYQCLGRIRRDGQKAEKLFAYDLVVRETVDDAILRSLAAGEDLYQQVQGNQHKLRGVMNARLF